MRLLILITRISFYLVFALYAQLASAEISQRLDVNGLLELSLEELLDYQVVSPTRTATSISEVPGSVSVITYDQIRKSSAQTIPELLRLIPGVHVRWNPMVQTIEIRNFGSNPFTSRVLLLIDGIPYNSWNKGGFPQHPGFDFFNLENVKHLEVIRGPGSALYGENAFSGVINIVTLSGDEYQQTRATANYSDEHLRTIAVTHGSELGDHGSIFVSARKVENQLPTALWEENDSQAEATDFFIKAKYKGAQLSWYRRDDSFDGFHEAAGPPGNFFQSNDKIKQSINIVAANYAAQTDDGTTAFDANLSYADRDGSHCGACHSASQSPNFDEEIDHGYQAFGNAQLQYRGFDQHELMLGAEIRKVSAGDSFDQIPSAHDAIEETRYRKSAVFVQDTLSLADDQVKIIGGLRYDTKTSPGLIGGELSPRLAVVAHPTDKLTLRAGYSTAVRYPTFTELYQNVRFITIENTEGTVFTESYFKPNPDLDREKLCSYEAGVEYRFSPKLMAKLDIFRNEIKDPIILAYSRGAIGFENHPSDARVTGFEAELRAHPTRSLTGFIHWSYQDTDSVGSGTDSFGSELELTYAPRHKVNVGLTYTPTDRFSATLDMSWRDKHDAPAFWSDIVYDDPTQTRLKGYTYANIAAKYRIPLSTGNHFSAVTLGFKGKNLTDEKPIETLTGVANEVRGREFIFSIEYDFAN